MDNEKKEKIYIYTAITIVALVVILSIIFIWGQLFTTQKYKEVNKYENDISYESTMVPYYENLVAKELKISNFEELLPHISTNYLSSVGLENASPEEIKSYLRDNGLIGAIINITSTSYSSNYDGNYYRIRYNSGKLNKYVNVIENKPYSFVITFDQGNISAIIPNSSVTKNVNEVIYNFEMVDCTSNSVTYDITISNESEYVYQYDFSALNHAQLIYDDDKLVNIATNVISSNDDYTINPGSSKTYTFIYNIDSSNQFLINGFKFTNVKIGTAEKQTVSIKF